MKSLLSAALVALPLALGATTAAAQTYPSKPIRWLVPYPAGGGSDFLARTIGQQLSTHIGQPVTIENKPGGNTAIAASDVARAAPDGYTVLSADNGTMVFNSALYSKLTYNPDKDLTPVTLMGRFPMILVVGPNSDARDAKDFIAKAKAAPGKLSYGSAGAGSPHHLAMELLKTQAGLHMAHSPYRGAAPALGDLAGGQIPAMMVDLAAGAGFIKSGKVRALAVANDKRLPQLPDVPTFAESGGGNYSADAWYGLLAPAGLPEPIAQALERTAADFAKSASAIDKLRGLGLDAESVCGNAFASRVAREVATYSQMAKALDLKAD